MFNFNFFKNNYKALIPLMILIYQSATKCIKRPNFNNVSIIMLPVSRKRQNCTKLYINCITDPENNVLLKNI